MSRLRTYIIIFVIMAFLFPGIGFTQDSAVVLNEQPMDESISPGGSQVDDNETRTDGNYVALAVTLLIWVCLFIYLMHLDKRVRDLKKRN